MEKIQKGSIVHHDEKRGIVKTHDDTQVFVIFDSEEICVPRKSLELVYCLGLPKDFRVTIRKELEHKDRCLLALSQAKSFYIVWLGDDAEYSYFLRINPKFFKMVAQSMKNSHLRIYATTFNSKTGKIQFYTACSFADMTTPWYFDFAPDIFQELTERFSQEEFVTTHCRRKLREHGIEEEENIVKVCNMLDML
jgi:hypothetical protein